MYGWRILIPPPCIRSRSHGRPVPMWSMSERGLYCVSTRTLSTSELTQLDRLKSMRRYLPPNGTAGFERIADRADSRSPAPPARTTARTPCMARRSPLEAETPATEMARRPYHDAPSTPARADPQMGRWFPVTSAQARGRTSASGEPEQGKHADHEAVDRERGE